MIRLFNKTLKQLQNLRGKLEECRTDSDFSSYWLISAVISARTNSKGNMAQSCIYAMESLGINKEEMISYINQWSK